LNTTGLDYCIMTEGIHGLSHILQESAW